MSAPAYHPSCRALHSELHNELKLNHSEHEKIHFTTISQVKSDYYVMAWFCTIEVESRGERRMELVINNCHVHVEEKALQQYHYATADMHTLGCQQPNELSSPVEIRGHVCSIRRWKLISVTALAKNDILREYTSQRSRRCVNTYISFVKCTPWRLPLSIAQTCRSNNATYFNWFNVFLTVHHDISIR